MVVVSLFYFFLNFLLKVRIGAKVSYKGFSFKHPYQFLSIFTTRGLIFVAELIWGIRCRETWSCGSSGTKVHSLRNIVGAEHKLVNYFWNRLEPSELSLECKAILLRFYHNFQVDQIRNTNPYLDHVYE